MIPLESQLCPQKLSKQIVELGGSTDSWFKWLYITKEESIESKAKYILSSCERYTIIKNIDYPAYTLEEILHKLPEGYILSQYSNTWYCKYSEDEWSNTIFYKSAVEACAYAYIRVLKEAKRE